MTIGLVSDYKLTHAILKMGIPLEVSSRFLLDMDDLNYFKENFYTGMPNETTDELYDFFEDKVKRLSEPIDTFLSRCQIGSSMLGVVFEETFFERFSEETIEMFSQAFINHVITPTQLYLNFQNAPLTRIVRYIT